MTPRTNLFIIIRYKFKKTTLSGFAVAIGNRDSVIDLFFCQLPTGYCQLPLSSLVTTLPTPIPDYGHLYKLS